MRIVIENLRQDVSEDEIREALSPAAPIGKIVLIKEGSMPTTVIEMEMTRTQAEVLAMRIDGLIYKGQELRAWAPLRDGEEARPQSTSATAPPRVSTPG
ncbi:MAG: hypothetical protein IPL99_25045 [Candidatus Competibacteraceae bacterium]|nr:hypothetical protein [Candidatus Competibacteraceae bacterium]